MYKIFFLFTLSIALLTYAAQEEPHFFPKTIEEKTSQDIIIQGIILVGHQKDLVLEDLDQYSGMHVHGLDLPGNVLALKNQLLQNLIGKQLNQKSIRDGQDLIVQYYKASGHPLVVVKVPNQKVTDGVVQYIVSESKIGKITYTGNKWTPTNQLQKNIRHHEGDYFDANLMQQDLIWLNRNPFRDTILVINPGESEETTDINFVSKDLFPYRIYVGTDNTGYESTGKNRLFTGVHFGNLFQLDQRLSYQYTVSTKFGSFYAHTAQYIIPFRRHILDFYGGYSGIRAVMPISRVKSNGQAWQASSRYIVPLRPFGNFNHEFKWGVDYKQTNVNLVFNAIPILGSQTVITQLALAYSWSLESSKMKISSNFEWFISPGDIFPHQSKSDYQTLRPSAKSNYTYVRMSLTPIFYLPSKFEALLKTEFQLADCSLLSSEQFGLGGLYTVRGYDERILNTDNALLLSGELRTPPLSPITKSAKSTTPELFQFLCFVDYGCGANHNPTENERNFRYLLSTGLGFRYYYGHYVNFRADLGFPLHHDIGSHVSQHGGGMFNFSAIIGF